MKMTEQCITYISEFEKRFKVSIAKLNTLEPFSIFIAAIHVLIQLQFYFCSSMQISDFMVDMVKITLTLSDLSLEEQKKFLFRIVNHHRKTYRSCSKARF